MKTQRFFRLVLVLALLVTLNGAVDTFTSLTASAQGSDAQIYIRPTYK